MNYQIKKLAKEEYIYIVQWISRNKDGVKSSVCLSKYYDKYSDIDPIEVRGLCNLYNARAYIFIADGNKRNILFNVVQDYLSLLKSENYILKGYITSEVMKCRYPYLIIDIDGEEEEWVAIGNDITINYVTEFQKVCIASYLTPNGSHGILDRSKFTKDTYDNILRFCEYISSEKIYGTWTLKKNASLLLDLPDKMITENLKSQFNGRFDI